MVRFQVKFLSGYIQNGFPLFCSDDLVVTLDIIKKMDKVLGYRVPLEKIESKIWVEWPLEYGLYVNRDIAEKCGYFTEKQTVIIMVPENSLEIFTSLYIRWCPDRKTFRVKKKINGKKLLNWWTKNGFPAGNDFTVCLENSRR